MESLVLNKDNVKLKVNASDWEEAVRIGAGMLVEQGCAKQSYVDGIIASVKRIRALHCHCRWNRNAAHKTRTGSYWDRL